MSHRPHDPFSPNTNWTRDEPGTVDAEPSTSAGPVPDDAPKLPAPEKPAQRSRKPSKPRRATRTRAKANVSLEEALARLDGEK